MRNRRCFTVIAFAAVILLAGFDGLEPAAAHHVLGRPSYGLSEDSNTPPGEQLETTSGDYFATFMAFPAFPQPGEPARVNLYLTRLDGDGPYDGRVAFSIREDGWFSGKEDPLGVQIDDDKVYRQGFAVSEPGNYVIVARFESDGEEHVLEFPLRIGDAGSSGMIAVGAGTIMLVLVVLTLVHRRRLTRAKIRSVRDEARSDLESAARDQALGRGH